MKKLLESVLFRIPLTYARLLRIKSNWNLDKYLFLLLARSGDVVLDGGANIGHYSILFSKLVGRKGKVYSFEPVPPTFLELEKNLNQSGSKNVESHAFALGEKSGQATIHLPDGISGHAALKPHEKAWGDVAVAPSAFDLGVARGYQSFTKPASEPHQLDLLRAVVVELSKSQSRPKTPTAT